jgi:anti-sigma factor RsiW
MRDGHHTRPEHPDELLAGYVDGSASPEERRTVDTHLAGCSRCRKELALARTARTALASLPQLDAPGLAAQGIDALRSGRGGDEVAERRETRRRRQWQASWAALGAAAAVLALFVVVPLALNRASDEAPGGLGAPALSPERSADYPPVLDRGKDHDQASILALARQLAARAQRGEFEGDRRLLGETSPGRERPLAVDASSSVVVECLAQGTGLPPETVPVYLEKATYRGTPAFVVAVLDEGETRSHLRVYAVSQQGCSFLFEADQPV